MQSFYSRAFHLTLLFLSIFSISSALKFDLVAKPAGSSNKERCIRNFVAKETLVVVTATLDGSKGDGQQVNIHVCDYVPRVINWLTWPVDSGHGGQ